ncbi:hypothetical protein H2248_003324 [Termitomyces sp. 'cryptogamus']|nr:hypothetical protein H2248_003324 [Termitomyces sp. 'cryptogamus']
MSTGNTNTPNPPTFPNESHFDGTNFASFRDRVLIATRTRGARGYLDGSIVNPDTENRMMAPTEKVKAEQQTADETKTTPTSDEPMRWTSQNPTAEEWDMRDAWTLSLIVNNCKNPIGLGIKMGGTAAEAWKALTNT